MRMPVILCYPCFGKVKPFDRENARCGLQISPCNSRESFAQYGYLLDQIEKFSSQAVLSCSK